MEAPSTRPKRAAAARAKAAIKAPDDVVSRIGIEDAVALIGAEASPLIVVSGSGISASAGLATFSASQDGLYERARKRYKLKHGMELFHYRFYRERPADALSFLAKMCCTARKCSPTATHVALVALERTGLLHRHYTMNIDGLHTTAGSTLWHTRCPIGRGGKTVELHGCLHELVDVSTRRVYSVDEAALERLKDKRPAFKQTELREKKPLYIADYGGPTDDDEEIDGIEDHQEFPCRVRFRVLFYDDLEHDCIVDSNAIFDLIASDVGRVRLVLWLGVSFEQSASCDYLRRVQAAADQAESHLIHLVVNPSYEAAFNASCLVNAEASDIRECLQTRPTQTPCSGFIQTTSDDLFASLLSATPTLFNDPPRLTANSRLLDHRGNSDHPTNFVNP